MKLNFKYFLIIFLIISNIAFCYLWYNEHNNAKLNDNSIKQLSAITVALSPQTSINYENNGLYIGNCIGKDTLGTEFKLVDYFNGSMLICRYLDGNCHLCVEHALNIIKSSMSNFDYSKVIFMGDIQKMPLFRRTIHSYKIENYQNISVTRLNLPIENSNEPYIFAIDSNLCVKGVYLPNRLSAEFAIDSLSINDLYRICVSNKNK